MNHSYLRTTRRTLRPCYQLLLLLLLIVPGLAQAQNFTETFSSVSSRQTIANAEAEDGFDNVDLTFTGVAIGSPNNTPSTGYTYLNGTGSSTSASGGRSIVMGEAGAAASSVVINPATNYSLAIEGITTTAGPYRISFGLNAPAGAQSSDLVLEYRVGNTGSFIDIPFSFTLSSGWQLVSTSATLPAASANDLTIRFRKPAGNSREYRIDDVTFRSFSPSLTATITSQIFPNTPVNQRSAPQTLTVTGADLTSNALVTAPAGYLVRLSGVGSYEQSITVSPNANGNVSELVEVIFAPTFTTAPGPNYPQTVSGNLAVTSTGATTRTLAVTGQATEPQAVLTANPTSLAFGTQTVGTTSASQPFQLIGQDLIGNVTVSVPVGFEIRVGSGAFSPNPLILNSNGGSLNVQIDVRFVPGATGTIMGNVVATGSGTSQATVAVSGSGAPAPTTPTINAAPTALNFQTVTNSGSAQTQTFTVSATNLSGPLTLTPSNANIQIRNATAGGSFSDAALVIEPNPSGNITNQTIEVTLVPTIGAGPFSGTIALTSTGAPQVNVSVIANNPSGNISDISLTNAVLREFSTSPGVPSSVQSYNVSADNLLQDLTILAPQFFQISLTPTGFGALGTATGNSLTLPRTTGSPTPSQNGNVPLTTIYVRYFPPLAQTNRGQVVSNSSAPARTQFVSVNGSSEPEVNVRGTFTPVVNQVKGTTSAIQSLVIVGARLNTAVTVRVPQDPEAPTTPSPLNPNRTPQFQISRVADFSDIGSASNPTGFLLTLTPDANDSIARVPLYVRYAPTRVGTALADLLFRTSDLNSNVEFNRVPNARLQGNAIAVEPTRQSSATAFRSADGTSVTINFRQEDGSAFPGNPEAAGFGQNRIIIASTSNTLPVASFPQDGVPYNPNSVYGGSGSSNINGNFVVFASSATTSVVTGLNPAVQYYFFTFEYNNDQVGGAENYRTPNIPITVLPPSPLPVELVSFTAQLRDSKVQLNWVTASEKNNRGFEVQRSQDGRQFSVVLFKEGRGTTSARTSYDAVDAQPLPGVSYYRLKQIDNDGVFAYSPVVIVQNDGLTKASFFPNPTTGKLTILLPKIQTTDAQRVRILDLTGRVVREEALPTNGEVDMSALQAGTYVVTVGSGKQQVTQRIVKN